MGLMSRESLKTQAQLPEIQDRDRGSGQAGMSFSTALAEIEGWLMSAPVRKRRTRLGPGALRLAGLP